MSSPSSRCPFQVCEVSWELGLEGAACPGADLSSLLLHVLLEASEQVEDPRLRVLFRTFNSPTPREGLNPVLVQGSGAFV